MNLRFSSLVPILLLVAGAGMSCAHRMIPGTDIQDTSDTRALLQLFEQYKSALEAKDARGIARLLAPDFRDDGGTPDIPEDDLTADNVATKLPARLAKVDTLTLNMNVRKINVDGNVADAIYRFNANYRLPKLTTRAQSDSDLERMTFRRVDGQWKITSGI